MKWSKSIKKVSDNASKKVSLEALDVLPDQTEKELETKSQKRKSDKFMI